jgi:hypothetical protein
MSEPQEPAAEQQPKNWRQHMQAIATTSEGLPAAWEPAGLADAWVMAQMLSKSELVPKPLRGKPADLWIVLWNAKELGMTSMDGLNHLHVVHGRIGQSAQLMQRRCLAHADCEQFDVAEADSKHAVVEYKRKGHPQRRVEFTIEQAKAAGLLGKADSAWNNWTEDMLVARAISRGARRGFPDALGPIAYLPDELRSLPADDGSEPTEAELVQAKTQAVIERVQRGRGRGKGAAALLPDPEPEPEEKNVTPEHRLADPAGILSTAPAAVVPVDEELARHEARAAEVRAQRGTQPTGAARFAAQAEDALSQLAKAPPPTGAQRVLSPPLTAATAPARKAPPPEREPGEDDEAPAHPQTQTMSTEVPQPAGPVERLSDDQVEALLAQARGQNYRAGGEQAFRDFTSRTYKLRLERIAAAAFPALMEELKADAAVQMKRERA